MNYRVELETAVGEYLRGLEGFTREGRLAMYGFMNVLRDYGDEAREGCPRPSQESTVFRLRWTFDAGPTIRNLDVVIDDAKAGEGLLNVVYADLVPLPES